MLAWLNFKRAKEKPLRNDEIGNDNNICNNNDDNKEERDSLCKFTCYLHRNKNSNQDVDIECLRLILGKIMLIVILYSV